MWVDAYPRKSKLTHVGFADEDRARCTQTRHRYRILLSHGFTLAHQRACHGGLARHIKVVFQTQHHAMQCSYRYTALGGFIEFASLRQSCLLIEVCEHMLCRCL